MKSLLVISAMLAVFAQSSGAQSIGLGTPGIISDVALYPNKVAVFTPTTVSIAGAGECGTVLVSFGDGRDTTLTSVKFPRNVMHSYTKAGTFIVSARPGQTCNAASGVTATATVEGSALDALCALTGCETPTGRTIACAKPTIKSVSFVTPLEPKEEFVIFGCGFGDASARGAQRVNIKGSFPATGTLLDLEVLSWSETAIKARMPYMTGVRDQTAWVQVANDVYSSNQWGVAFRATRAMQYLPSNVATIQCADLVYLDRCVPRPSFGGSHANLGSASASGTDVFTITLANGWVLDGWSSTFNTVSWPLAYTELYALDRDPSPPVYDFSGLVPGAGSGVVRVSWKTGPETFVDYRGWVRAKGPLGVPLR